MSFTIKFESEEEKEVPWTSAFNMGDLFRVIIAHMESSGVMDFNCERVVFYNRDDRRINFGSDNDLVKQNTFFHIIIVNKNMLDFAFEDEFRAQTSLWPWRITIGDTRRMAEIRAIRQAWHEEYNQAMREEHE